MSTRKDSPVNHVCILTLQKELRKYQNIPGEDARKLRILFHFAIENYKKGYTEFEYYVGKDKISVTIEPPPEDSS